MTVAEVPGSGIQGRFRCVVVAWGGGQATGVVRRYRGRCETVVDTESLIVDADIAALRFHEAAWAATERD
ncbi:MAG TPA: hypothetical protein VFQ40_07830, partial [Actinomycetota bacterium]|nr:hypothetical protein [Actinomycetota bacterium]